MTNKKLTIISVSLLSLFLVGAFATFKQQAQDKTSVQNEEATLVQTGQVTEKGREYSKLYKKKYSYRNGYKLSELSAAAKREGNGQEIGVAIGEPLIPTVGTSFPAKGNDTSKQFLGKISCKADAVVLGTVVSKTAHLTEDETFVYTEYEFLIKEVLKNNPASVINDNSRIQFTRPGGLIKLDNQLIRVEDRSYAPLQNKKDYLLFLKFIPKANGYMVSDVNGDFVLENKSFKQLRKTIFSEELENISDSQVFLGNIKNVVSAGCSEQIKAVN
jgi:hypothetical protein